MALVRLFVGVDDFVSAERRGLPETLAADLADERPRAGMHGHVAREIVVGIEHFPAFIARESLVLLAIGGRGRHGAGGRRRRVSAGRRRTTCSHTTSNQTITSVDVKRAHHVLRREMAGTSAAAQPQLRPRRNGPQRRESAPG